VEAGSTAATNSVDAALTETNSLTSANVLKSTAAGKKSPSPFDPMLDETERILEDYISDLGKSGILKANQ
jgi:hypothetical protein